MQLPFDPSTLTLVAGGAGIAGMLWVLFRSAMAWVRRAAIMAVLGGAAALGLGGGGDWLAKLSGLVGGVVPAHAPATKATLATGGRAVDAGSRNLSRCAQVMRDGGFDALLEEGPGGCGQKAKSGDVVQLNGEPLAGFDIQK